MPHPYKHLGDIGKIRRDPRFARRTTPASDDLAATDGCWGHAVW